MLYHARRIVTTNGPDGLSRIVSDAPSPHKLESFPNRGLVNLWVTDGAPHLKSGSQDGADRPVILEPPEGGTIFRFFQLAPRPEGAAATPERMEAAAAAAFAAMKASHLRVDIRRHPGMHKSDTIDYIMLLRGRVRMMLDIGEVDLEPFDVVIQNGTNHAWVNLESEPALMMAVLISAAPATAPK